MAPSRIRKETPEQRRAWQKAYNERVKREAIYAYGDCCVCCGESNLDFLCLDHVNGGGNKHRRLVGNNVHAVLRREGFPPGYQVMCFNCNWGKRLRGVCPHQQVAA